MAPGERNISTRVMPQVISALDLLNWVARSETVRETCWWLVFLFYLRGKGEGVLVGKEDFGGRGGGGGGKEDLGVEGDRRE